MNSVLIRNWWAVALRGALAILFGILAILMPGVTLAVMVLIFGAYSVVDGVFALVAGLRAARHHERWWHLALEGIVDLVVGNIRLVHVCINDPVHFFLACVHCQSLFFSMLGAATMQDQSRRVRDANRFVRLFFMGINPDGWDHSVPRECDPARLYARQRQIDIGKNTEEYRNYIKQVPPATRDVYRLDEHPRTPPPELNVSVRAWRGLVSQLRWDLHGWCTSGDEDEDCRSSCSMSTDTSSDTQSRRIRGRRRGHPRFRTAAATATTAKL